MAGQQAEIEAMYRAMRDLLPDVLTETDPVSASFFNSIVYSLATNEGILVSDLNDFKDNLNVLTCASGGGIEAWEAIAGLEPRDDLNLESRRARVFSRISAKPTTLDTLKSIIRNYVGSDEFGIFEYYTLGDPASAFRYKIQLQRPPSTDYDEESLQQDVLRVQPHHCGDFVEIEDRWESITDTFAFTESVSAVPINFFVIGTSLIEGSDVIAPI